MSDEANPAGETLRVPGERSVAIEDRTVQSSAPPARTSLPGPGEKLGRFEVVREIGRGGSGVVLEARDPEIDRPVALKLVLPGAPGERPGGTGREEARAVTRLSHPNIVDLHDAGACEAGPYLAYELLHGEPLSARLQRGPLGVVEAARIVREVARGLAHAHTHGIAHGDLRPSSVFLCDDGEVKILDLGLAFVFGRADAPLEGTPGWMPPERRGGARGDERTDVWALGAILFRAVAGRDPVRSRLEFPGAPDLEALLDAMLEVDPALRPRDGQQVVDALAPVVRRMELSPPGPHRVRAVGTFGELRGSARLGLALAALSALAMLALLAIGAVALVRWIGR